MASAFPEVDYVHPSYYDDQNDSEPEDYENIRGVPSTSAGQSPHVDEYSKQNGTLPVEVDRFGFFNGGDHFTNPNGDLRLPVEVLRKRELKWLDMMENWEKWMSKRFKKVRDRCRKGIPSSLRARAWQYLCGSKYLMERHRGRFDEFDKLDGDPKVVDDIEKDLHRQFPFHEMFQSQAGSGQQDLFRVLKAYSIHNPRDGYCQAQAPVAAVLLMHMPAEQAFWALVALCDKYLPGYYSPGLEAVQVDGDVLFGLLKRVSYPTYKHLKKHNVDPILYMTEWFMCIFSRTLPWTSVLRVWDMFFCEGVKVMFRVGLVLFKHALGSSEQLANHNGLYEVMERLRHLPMEYLQEEFIARECGKLSLSERDMEKEHHYQVKKRLKAKEQKDSPKKSKNKHKAMDASRTVVS